MTEDKNGLVIPDRLREILIRRKQTVALAESVTAGHLQVAFSMAKDAMIFFQGGITAYNLQQKTRHLKVDPVEALASNCVSEEVASQMAKQAAIIFSSDWGIAITGYASPIPEMNIYDLFACYAISRRNKQTVSHTITVENNSPLEVRLYYTNYVIEHFQTILCNEEE
jgi:nicotinamide-nucleotide amidase